MCWQQVLANEWMLVPAMAVMSVTGASPQVPEPGAPGPFSLSDADRVREVLGGAGFSDVDIAPHNDAIAPSEDEIALSEDEIADYAGFSLRVGAAREALKEADDGTRAEARAPSRYATRCRKGASASPGACCW